MSWQQMNDPNNVENGNAGNGGDLVKHTVYLATLRSLLQHSPWRQGLRLRECHAGRGVYRIPDPDSRNRRRLIECLYSPSDRDVSVLLHDAQRGAQIALSCWPAVPSQFSWYVGSAVINAWMLRGASDGEHLIEFYELEPPTRSVLKTVFADGASAWPSLRVRILPAPENGREFDGETYVEEHVAEWDLRDILLLDPFAMWRQRKHQAKRDRYRRVFDTLLAHGSDAPSLILFWTWGQAFCAAEGDLKGTRASVANGYQCLRDLLHHAGRRFIRVTWRWGLQFAMWVLVPPAHLDNLRHEINTECWRLRDHLFRHSCRNNLGNPDVDVTID